MMDIITNPVLIAVIIMTALCLLKCNVYVAVVIAGLSCGVIGGASLLESFSMFMGGMGNSFPTMVSRLFLGMLAVAMTQTGVGEVFAPRITRAIGKKVWILIVALGLMGVLAETVILIFSAFVPIVVPPLLTLFNEYKVDRRKVAAIIMCGLQMGYACTPLGYGVVFQTIVQDEMIRNGVEVPLDMIWKSNWPIVLSLLIAAGLVMWFYRKPREYTPVPGVTAPLEGEDSLPEGVLPKIEWKHWACLLSAVIAVVTQMITGSLPLGSLCAVISLVVLRAIKWKKFDKMATDGIAMMMLVSFVVMAGGGFANVAQHVGKIDVLISTSVSLLGGSKLGGAFVMLLLGLIVTMGIGSSFGTVPIVAVIMVPMGLEMGFSVPAIIMLISTAAVLGDAGSPASDQTLIPSAAFNLDGQHDHIWDTCVPSFLWVNLPLVVVGTIAACLM